MTLYKELGDNKMKKRVCLFGIIVGIMCSLLCGCSNSENDNNKQSSIPANTFSSSAENSVIGANEYYSKNAEVVSVTKAKESDKVPSEQEATKLLSDRGCNTEGIVTDYTMDGDYLDETGIEDSSTEKHPIYKMLYGSESDILWNIYMINGVISAYPVSYNLVSERDAVLLITETDTVTSYDYNSNQFFETIPNESEIIIRKVDKIDKETLDKLSIGGLNKL